MGKIITVAKLKIARNHILKPLAWIACLLPLGWLVYGGYAGTLGANPIERITHRTGLTTLVLLLTGLAITPLRRWTGLLWLIQYRRLIGLFAFFYGCLHLLTYLWLDQMFSPGGIVHDVAKRPFITMGMTAWLCLLPLALTSTQSSIRRLGKNWSHPLLLAGQARQTPAARVPAHTGGPAALASRLLAGKSSGRPNSEAARGRGRNRRTVAARA